MPSVIGAFSESRVVTEMNDILKGHILKHSPTTTCVTVSTYLDGSLENGAVHEQAGHHILHRALQCVVVAQVCADVVAQPNIYLSRNITFSPYQTKLIKIISTYSTLLE